MRPNRFFHVMLMPSVSPVTGPSPALALRFRGPASTEVGKAADTVGVEASSMGGNSPRMALPRLCITSAPASLVRPSATIVLVGWWPIVNVTSMRSSLIRAPRTPKYIVRQLAPPFSVMVSAAALSNKSRAPRTTTPHSSSKVLSPSESCQAAAATVSSASGVLSAEMVWRELRVKTTAAAHERIIPD